MEGHFALTNWLTLDYAVADVEGNGKQPPDLVELAVLPITAGIIGEPMSWLVKPSRPIIYLARSVHGITSQDIADAAAFPEIAREVRQAFGSRVLIAHNAHVDISVLRRELGECEPPEVVDTLKPARRLLPGRISYKLGVLVKALSLDAGLPPGLRSHRAADDVLVTARLFTRLATHKDGSPLSLAELRGQAADHQGGGADEAASLF